MGNTTIYTHIGKFTVCNNVYVFKSTQTYWSKVREEIVLPVHPFPFLGFCQTLFPHLFELCCLEIHNIRTYTDNIRIKLYPTVCGKEKDNTCVVGVLNCEENTKLGIIMDTEE